MTRLSVYEQNVHRRYAIADKKARGTRLAHRLMVESGDGLKGLTAVLIESGHGLTGPGGLYGMTALSDFMNPAEDMPCRQLALDFGKALIKKVRRLRVLPEFPRTEVNFKSGVRFEREPLDPNGRRKLVRLLVEDLVYIMTRHSKFDKWALGSLTFKQAYHRSGFEGWGATGDVTSAIEPMFRFQTTMCNAYSGGPVSKRTLKSDAFVEQQKRNAQVVKEFDEEEMLVRGS